jgi:hypothetical protein
MATRADAAALERLVAAGTLRRGVDAGADAGGAETRAGMNAERGDAGRDERGPTRRGPGERKWRQWTRYAAKGVLAELVNDEGSTMDGTTVYTIGYQGRTPEQLRRIAEERDAVIFDIRQYAGSRNPMWAKSNLAKALAGRYRHVNALGNANYKGALGPGAGIVISDFDAGRAAIDAEGRSVILMCACRDAEGCHRTTVANLLRATGAGYRIEEIPFAAPVATAQASLL